MDQAQLRQILLARPGAEETFPFDAQTLVLKVGGKMFALVPLEAPQLSVSLKCDPARGLFLRDTFPAITPAYHMNKTHWIALRLDGSLPEELVQDLIDESYQLVRKSLPKAVQASLAT